MYYFPFFFCFFYFYNSEIYLNKFLNYKNTVLKNMLYTFYLINKLFSFKIKYEIKHSAAV